VDAVKTIRATFESGRPFLLDGGLGGELELRGFDVSSALWSAELILERPEALLEVHRDFLEAGARCISTASYQASEPGLKARGLSAAEIEGVFRASVDLACRARDQFMRDNPGLAYRPLVAASVGPYGAYLAEMVPSTVAIMASAKNSYAIFTRNACIGWITRQPTLLPAKPFPTCGKRRC
jgi:homocysteine S-methyltransferase